MQRYDDHNVINPVAAKAQIEKTPGKHLEDVLLTDGNASYARFAAKVARGTHAGAVTVPEARSSRPITS